jgi:hypothetical protein
MMVVWSGGPVYYRASFLYSKRVENPLELKAFVIESVPKEKVID